MDISLNNTAFLVNRFFAVRLLTVSFLPDLKVPPLVFRKAAGLQGLPSVLRKAAGLQDLPSVPRKAAGLKGLPSVPRKAAGLRVLPPVPRKAADLRILSPELRKGFRTEADLPVFPEAVRVFFLPRNSVLFCPWQNG